MLGPGRIRPVIDIGLGIEYCYFSSLLHGSFTICVGCVGWEEQEGGGVNGEMRGDFLENLLDYCDC